MHGFYFSIFKIMSSKGRVVTKFWPPNEAKNFGTRWRLVLFAEFLHTYWVARYRGEVNFHLPYEFYNWAYEKL